MTRSSPTSPVMIDSLADKDRRRPALAQAVHFPEQLRPILRPARQQAFLLGDAVAPRPSPLRPARFRRRDQTVGCDLGKCHAAGGSHARIQREQVLSASLGSTLMVISSSDRLDQLWQGTPCYFCRRSRSSMSRRFAVAPSNLYGRTLRSNTSRTPRHVDARWRVLERAFRPYTSRASGQHHSTMRHDHRVADLAATACVTDLRGTGPRRPRSCTWEWR